VRLLHTADWHIGRVFHGTSLLDDQAAVLDEIVEIARAEQPDVVIIAGDLYDRAVPPPEAVSLLDDVLSRFVLDLDMDVVLIAGNHDSPERVAFGGRLLSHARVHVVADALTARAPIVLFDEHGPVQVSALPFVEPELLRRDLATLDEESVPPDVRARARAARTPADALSVLLDVVPASSGRRVVVAHGSVVGAAESESERAVPAFFAVDVERFSRASYVALGHHHRAQNLSPRARYSGSPLAYAFSEADTQKSVTLVDVDAAGDLAIREAPLTRARRLAVLEGTLAELLASPRRDLVDAYVKVRLTDDVPVLDPHARLAEVYPRLLVVEHLRLTARRDRPTPQAPRVVLDDDALFRAFHREVVGRELDDEEAAVVEEARATVAASERSRG